MLVVVVGSGSSVGSGNSVVCLCIEAMRVVCAMNSGSGGGCIQRQ